MSKPRLPLRRESASSEPLESRLLLHADFAILSSRGTLILNATAGNDVFVVRLAGGDIEVEHDGVIEDFVPSQVLRVYCDAGEGNDNISVEINARSTLLGGNGDDSLSGGSKQDSLVGDAGRDVLTGNIGNDTLVGGGGGDKLYGKGGSDSLIGGSGKDLLNGGLGADYMDAGRDNDRLFADGANDSIFGGSGTDTLVSADSGSEPTADGVEVFE